MSTLQVFLSYHNPDRLLAERLGRELRTRDSSLEVFLAPWALRPGAFWMPMLAETIERADAFLLLIGRGGPGSWQLLEYYEALDRKTRQPDFPLIPLLLPEAEPRIPFFNQIHWLQIPDPGFPQVLDQLLQVLHGKSLEPMLEPWRARNPYKGLEAFTETDADFFFGRERLTREVVERLQNGERFLTLVGNSGVGKSSLVRAGVIATLRRQHWPDHPEAPWPHDLRDSRSWLFLTLIPGERPLYALARAFVSQWYEPEDPRRGEVAEQWTQSLEKGTGLAKLLEATAEVFHDRHGLSPPRRFVLIVDQGEELYTRSPVDRARRFSELLAQGWECSDVFILDTLRSDYYGHLQADEALFPITTRVDVEPLRENELRRVIMEPARALDATFEDEGMATDIAVETARDPGTLPLLSYMMEDMWKRLQQRGDGMLRWQDYHQLGGVRGALAQRAESYLHTCSPMERTTLRRLFTLRLVYIPRAGDVVRRRTYRSECTDAEWAQVQVLAGKEWRLLVTSQEEGEATAELAHEVLLRAWNRLTTWIQEEREFLQWKGRLEDARHTWENSRRDEGTLLRGSPLAEAERWLAERSDDLTLAEREFIHQSVRLRRRRERVRWGVTVGAVAMTLILAVTTWFAWNQWQHAEEQRQVAEEQRRLAFARQLAVQAELLRTQQANLLQTSVLFAVAAMRRSPSPEVDETLRHGLSLLPSLIADISHQDRPTAIAFSPDGSYLATASEDRETRLWEISEGRVNSQSISVTHRSVVRALAFGPQGSYLATAGEDDTARIWRVPSGEEVATLNHGADVVGVTFSQTGNYLATASWDHTAGVWRWENNRETVSPAPIESLVHDGFVRTVTFSPNGEYLATASGDYMAAGGNHRAQVWEVAAGRKIASKRHGDRVNDVAFSPQGEYLATASQDGTARIFAPDGKEDVALRHQDAVWDVSFSPDGTYLATASKDHTARLWEVATAKEGPRMKHEADVVAVAFSPDEEKTFLATASWDGTARLWEITSGREVARMTHQDRVTGIAFSPQGNHLATASRDRSVRLWRASGSEKVGIPPDGTIVEIEDQEVQDIALSRNAGLLATVGPRSWYARIWETASGRELSHIEHKGIVNALTFGPKGKYLATGSDDRTAKVWRIASGQEITLPHEGPVNSVIFDPQGRYLATISEIGESQTVHLWDLDTGQQVPLMDTHQVRDAVFSPKGKYLATANSNGAAIVWEAVAGQKSTQVVHEEGISALAFDSTEEWLVTAGDDKTARVWKVVTGEEIIQLRHEERVKDIAIGPQGEYVVTVDRDNTVRVWKRDSGQQVASKDHQETILAVTFSPDGKYFTTASNDPSVRVRETTTGREVGHMALPHPITAAAFSPDEEHIAVASEDQTVRIWLLWPEALINEACKRLNRDITEDEWHRFLGEEWRQYVGDIEEPQACPDMNRL